MDLVGHRGLRRAGIRSRLVGHAAEPAADRRHGERAAPRRAKPPSSAMRAASRSSPPPRALISPTRRVMRTRRIASSRWICRAASRPASCPNCSVRWPQAGPAHAALRLSRGGAARRSKRRRPRSAASSRRMRAASTPALTSLRARPWEYLLLRAQPRAWLPEDSVLVVHSMWWQLQYGTLRDELDAAAPRARRGRAQRRRSRARAHRLRLCRPFGLGHA